MILDDLTIRPGDETTLATGEGTWTVADYKRSVAQFRAECREREARILELEAAGLLADFTAIMPDTDWIREARKLNPPPEAALETAPEVEPPAPLAPKATAPKPMKEKPVL